MNWEDLPKEIQDRMLEEQEIQGRPRNSDAFKEDVWNTPPQGGAWWADSREGYDFWRKVLEGNFDVFYEKYPNRDTRIEDQVDFSTYVSGVDPYEKPEMVSHPTHYGGDTTYETIKVIEAWDLNFRLGNCVKYISRNGKKGDALVDLKKALWYLQREINVLEGRSGHF